MDSVKNKEIGTNKYPSRSRHRWTGEEERYLSQHRTDGAALIAAALGVSELAVRRKAQKMGVSLRVSPGEVCPRCGLYVVRAGTVAARYGVCPACWERMKADAIRERRGFLDARRDYERAKKEV